MKLKKFRFLFFLLAYEIALMAGAQDDFLAGSVVKSEKWEIDRAGQMEIFQGSVSFRNASYELKADRAVYYKTKEMWEAEGSVYCLRKFEDGTSVASYCDKSTYYSGMEKAEMQAVKNPVKSVYTLKDSRKITTYAKKLHADNSAKAVFFESDFKVVTDSATVYGDRAVFYSGTADFIITGGPPQAYGEDNNYKLFMEAEKIKLNRDTAVIEAEKNVRGYILNRVMEK